jgi:UDP-3-O-[3-hydroxymyristoyl] N-acetylglucosamine deacetylase/3-hydroxyacyl-[acyl-carrier-protein] dehydratase
LEKQHTVAGEVKTTGVGLHTGQTTTMTFRPAPPDHGIAFVREDLDGSPAIPADLDHVVDLERGTTIGIGKARVHTVEHVLAALAGLKVDNVVVALDGPEPPVHDGSAKPYVDAILSVGRVPQDAPRRYLTVERPFAYTEPDRKVDVVVTPADEFRITFLVDYANPALGTQYTTLISLDEEFVEEYAPARTFCFLSEVEQLKAAGLAKGGGLDNAIIIADRKLDQSEIDRLSDLFDIDEKVTLGTTGILDDTPLRFPNEPVRHKAVDLLGDLALVGVPIKGHVLAARSGHAANVAVAHKLREMYRTEVLTSKYRGNRAGGNVLGIDGILKVMPHRYPMLLVDRILELIPGERVVGMKNVTINEPFFQGHFPGHPIMPGVLIVEAMAQCGGVLLLNMVDEPEEKVVYFMGIDGVRFRKPVLPGDTLRFELEMKSFKRGISKMSGRTFVGSEPVCEAELMAAVMPKDRDA